MACSEATDGYAGGVAAAKARQTDPGDRGGGEEPQERARYQIYSLNRTKSTVAFTVPLFHPPIACPPYRSLFFYYLSDFFFLTLLYHRARRRGTSFGVPRPCLFALRSTDVGLRTYAPTHLDRAPCGISTLTAKRPPTTIEATDCPPWKNPACGLASWATPSTTSLRSSP